MRVRWARLEEGLARAVLWGCLLVVLGALAAIVGHVLVQGLPGIDVDFLTTAPRASGREGGILTTIVATLYLVAGALAIAGPVGIACAIYLAEYLREGSLERIARFGVQTLAGVPSIIFGLFGFTAFVLWLGLGWSILSGSLTLAAMILPTLVKAAEEAIRAVPDSYRQGSLALGATKGQTILRVVLPVAMPGILSGVILSIGRVIGETAAVLLTAGSALGFAVSPLDSGRTMAVHLYLLAMEGISVPKAYSTSAVLILLVVGLNALATRITSRFTVRR